MKKIAVKYYTGVILVFIAACLLLYFVWTYESKPKEYNSVESYVNQLVDKNFMIDYFKQSEDCAYISVENMNRAKEIILIKKSDKWIEVQQKDIIKNKGEISIGNTTKINSESYHLIAFDSVILVLKVISQNNEFTYDNFIICDDKNTLFYHQPLSSDDTQNTLLYIGFIKNLNDEYSLTINKKSYRFWDLVSLENYLK